MTDRLSITRPMMTTNNQTNYVYSKLKRFGFEVAFFIYKRTVTGSLLNVNLCDVKGSGVCRIRQRRCRKRLSFYLSEREIILTCRISLFVDFIKYFFTAFSVDFHNKRLTPCIKLERMWILENSLTFKGGCCVLWHPV